MEEKLISYKTAKLAKQVGFEIITNYYYKATNPLVTDEDFNLVLLKNELKENYNFRSYTGLYLAPTQLELYLWLLESYKLHAYCEPFLSAKSETVWIDKFCNVNTTINKTYPNLNDWSYSNIYVKGFELALQSTLKYIIKNEKN